MSARGYSGTSISELAKESGLPASSIYWHFESKAGVLAAVMERGANRFFSDIAADMGLTDADPGTNLARLIRHSLETFGAHPEFLRLLMLLLLGSEGEHAQADVVERVRAEGRRHIHEGLAHCYRPWGAEAARAVADALADLLLAMVDGGFIAAQASNSGTDERLAEQMIGAVHGLAVGVRALGSDPA